MQLDRPSRKLEINMERGWQWGKKSYIFPQLLTMDMKNLANKQEKLEIKTKK